MLDNEGTPRTLRAEECFLFIRLFSERFKEIFFLIIFLKEKLSALNRQITQGEGSIIIARRSFGGGDGNNSICGSVFYDKFQHGFSLSFLDLKAAEH